MNIDDSFKQTDRSRAQAVFIREADQACAMGWGELARAQVKGYFGTHGAGEGEHNKQVELEQDTEGPKQAVQYRLEATRQAPKRSLLMNLLCCCGLFEGSRHQGSSVGGNPDQRLAMYLHWMFRVSFIFLFFVMCVCFFGLVVLFSGFIGIAGTLNPDCVRIGGEVFGHVGTPFADAFALSWTTFSTVGYGNAYPAKTAENDDPTNCFFITFITSLESLFGILYSGFCGAILFGKVLRIQSQAQVIFSDPVLIRYGPGLADVSNNNDDDIESQSPCPVLEFRIVNRLFNEMGGEIMDANLNVVANIDADDADPSLLTSSAAVSSDRLQMFGNGTPNDSASETDSEVSHSLRSHRARSMQRLGTLFNPVISSIIKSRDHQTVDEDPTSRLVSKHVFSKMIMEAADHPFFKRVWLARHVLDEHSPILKPKVRRQIRRNGGKWPERLNNYTAIRDSLQFNQILVSLNGVSNVSASSVYAQKIYDFVDVNIGYQFVNILYRDSEGLLGLDMDLLNDVRVQVGGGGEPLMFE